MTIYDYNMTMLQTNIANLKAKLSFYLAHVKKGQEVLVLERKHPIARLIASSKGAGALVIAPARRPIASLRHFKGMAPKQKIDAVELLRQDRNRR